MNKSSIFKIYKVNNPKASITIEASFIYPFLLFIFVNVIFLSFYLHDKIVANSLVYRQTLYLAIDNVNQETNSTTPEELIKTIKDFCLSPRRINLDYISHSNIIRLDGFYRRTDHITQYYEHCNDIRKYSVIIDSIKNIH
jgi:hypothetical protein